MNRCKWCCVALTALMLTGGRALATELGDPAPPLKIAEWVKGDKVKLADGKDKMVYVVEFWATWCAPCRESIPHLSEMQKKYAGKVTFIGISDEPTSKVKPFVEKMGEKMAYTVAVDDARATNNAYMKAFGAQGIPHAFIIDKSGAIAWEGHPTGMDKVLDKVLAGKWDIETAKTEAKERMEMMKNAQKNATRMREYFMLISKKELKDEAKAKKLAEEIYESGKKNAQLMNQVSWTIMTNRAIRHRDMDYAMKTAKAAYDACNGEDAAIVDTYARALYEKGKKEEAIKYQKKALDLAKDGENESLTEQLQDALDRYKEGKPGIMEGDEPEEEDEDEEESDEDKPKKDMDDDDDDGDGI